MKNKTILLTKKYLDYTFPVECTFKSDVKNINCHLKPGKLVISCNYYCSLNKLNKFIDDLPTKFMDKLVTISNNKDNEHQGYVYLLGKEYKCVNALDNPQKGEISYRNEEDLKRKIKSYALDIFTKEVRKYEPIMGITKPYKVTVRDMNTRLGTNSRKTYTIALSLKLIHYNLDVIDSVVVHELAHHYEFNHGKHFYEIVYKYCPNYDKMTYILKRGEYQ